MRRISPVERRAFLLGVRDMTPLLLGVMPFGAIFGALARATGVPAWFAQTMSWIVFAGSAQFITTQLIAAQSPWLVVILTGAVVNVRHMLYSASLAPRLRHLSMRWKVVLAYLLTDEAYGASIQFFVRHDNSDNAAPHWHLLGSGLALWLSWQLSTTVGILAGSVIPASWQLDFALPVTFIALAFPVIRDRPALAAMTVGGVVAVLAAGLPYRSGLMVAAAAGIAAGLVAEALQRNRAGADG